MHHPPIKGWRRRTAGCRIVLEFAGDSEYTVTISSEVTPAQLTIDPVAGGNVIFAGEGVINLATFTKSGAGKVTLGNGKNPFTTLTVSSGTLALGADQPLSTETATLYLEQGATLDLNGHSLFVGTASQQTAENSSAFVTNSNDSVTGTFTAGCGNTYAYSNRYYVFGGNTRYVTTGRSDNDLRFWGMNNYHTAGTVLSNVNFRVRSVKQFGTGPIIFTQGAGIDVASTNPNPYDYQNWTQDIEAYGSDNKISYGPASWSPTVTYSGALRGDGERRFSNSGWDPAMTLSGDLSAFTGTFIAGHSSDSSNKGIFLYNTTSTGLPDADVVQQSTSKDNKLYVSGGSDKTFGSLATEVAMPTNAYLLANSATTLVKTGSKSSSTYSGALCDYGSNVLSVEKIGADTTWTLTGTNHNFSGTFTVTAGKVVFANPQAVALGSQVVVDANGTIGGSGSITSPVSFTSGGKVEVSAGAANTLTFSGDIDASTLTVKLRENSIPIRNTRF